MAAANTDSRLESTVEGALAMRSWSRLSCSTYQSVVNGISSLKDMGVTAPVIVDALKLVVAVPEHAVIVVQTCPQLEVAVPAGLVDTAHVDVQ